MTNDDASEFLQRLAGLAELFDAKFSEAKSQLYFEALRDVALDDVIAGLNKAARDCKFMPKPIEIRTLALGDVLDHAEEAWIQFRAAQREIGAYNNWEPDDPIAAYSVAELFGSWPSSCSVELSHEMWASKRKEFIGVYRRNADRDVQNKRVLLPGLLGRERGMPSLWVGTDDQKVIGR